MSPKINAIVVLCVVIIAIGQVMFKQVAMNYNKTENLFDPSVFGILFVALSLYMFSTVLWVWALRYVELTKAYPYFALAFVLVPLVGWWLFKEELSLQYGVGVALIVTGIVVVTSAGLIFGKTILMRCGVINMYEG